MKVWYHIFTWLSIVFLVASTYFSSRAAVDANDKKSEDAHNNAKNAALLSGIALGAIFLGYLFVIFLVPKVKKFVDPRLGAFQSGLQARRQAYDDYMKNYYDVMNVD